MSASSRPPMTRAQKLKWYAEQLMADAVKDEKAGNGEIALTHYLEAADILLLLAKVEENYAAWKYYTDNASLCQQKARRLIATASKDGASPEPHFPSAGQTPRS